MHEVEPLQAMTDRGLVWLADAATRPTGPHARAPKFWDRVAEMVGREQMRRAGHAVPAPEAFYLTDLAHDEAVSAAETVAMMLNATRILPTRVELGEDDERGRVDCMAVYELLAEALMHYVDITSPGKVTH